MWVTLLHPDKSDVRNALQELRTEQMAEREASGDTPFCWIAVQCNREKVVVEFFFFLLLLLSTIC